MEVVVDLVWVGQQRMENELMTTELQVVVGIEKFNRQNQIC